MSVTIEKKGISIGRAEDNDHHDWNDLIERSPQTNPFHYREALEVQADHADATLHRLVGYKGQEPVGLFPGFEVTRGPVTTLFSPPPDLKATYLGPALAATDGMKRRKAERRHRRFLEGALSYFERSSPKYVHVRTAPGFDDARTFAWNGFDRRPAYTYRVDLTRGKDALWSAVSGDARSNVRSVRDADVDCTVGVGDRGSVERILDHVAERHAEQDERYPLTAEFLTDLYDRAPEGTVRPYVCTVDGEFATGMIALVGADAVYRWQGGAKPSVDLPVNDYLDWRIIEDAIEEGLDTYDLVGASTRRLTGYKAKFDPELSIHLSLERGTWYMEWAAAAYKRLR